MHQSDPARLQIVEQVAEAQEAVNLLLPQCDYVAALDVLDDLRSTSATHHIAGLQAFCHLPAQIAVISQVS